MAAPDATFSSTAAADSGCCDCFSSHPDHNKKGFDGIVQKRNTTDKLFLVGIWCLWIVMSIIGGRAVQDSSPMDVYKLVAPTDVSGNVCGYSKGYENLKYKYTISTNGYGACVAECPTVDEPETSTTSSDYICYDDSSYSTACMDNGVYDPETTDITSGAAVSCFCNLIRKSTSVLRRCMFDDSDVRQLYDNMDTPGGAGGYFQSFMADVLEVKGLIFGFGFGFALFLSFLFSHFLRNRWMAYFTVFFCIACVFASMIALVGLAQDTKTEWMSQHPRERSDTAIMALNAFSIIMVIIAGLFVCVVFACRTSILIATECLSLTSMCIEEMWMLVFTPIVQIVGMVLFFIPFVFYIFYIAAEGHFETVDITYNGQSVGSAKKWVFADPDKVGELLWFMFFCLLWTGNFIVSIGSIMIAISTATWYFTEPEKRKADISNATMFSAYYNTFRYHAGTAAFGGLVVAFVQFVRAVVMYVSKQLQSQASKTGDNCAKTTIQYITCCLQCCLACAESCLKFISKNAYIQTAIRGSSFCFGCKQAFFTIARNITRVGAFNIIQGYALLIIKMFVCFVTGGSFYYIINNYRADVLSDLVAPTVFVMIIAWLTASMFTDVYDTSMDTILMCFITDEECNGSPKFAPKEMADLVDKHGKMEVEMAKPVGNSA